MTPQEMGVREAIRAFFDRAAPGWDDAQVVDADKISVIVSLADLRPGMKVLDLGTGTGVLLPHLAARVAPGGQVVGLDVSEAMLAGAARKSERLHEQAAIKLVLGDAHDLPWPDASFDAVVCYSMFPHLDQPAVAVAEMARVLVPDGRLVVAHSESRTTINQRHREIGGVVISHKVPDREAMVSLLRSAGLKPVLLHDGDDIYVAVASRAPAGL
ncbi:MAG: methyltransferase domain-containing protein [Bacillota bacterium]|nr:methyltransferase domain-containing protein [Bacillota bacterium]